VREFDECWRLLAGDVSAGHSVSECHMVTWELELCDQLVPTLCLPILTPSGYCDCLHSEVLPTSNRSPRPVFERDQWAARGTFRSRHATWFLRQQNFLSVASNYIS
jgi:hypothetical protein